MTIAVTRLTPCFAARIDGADITRPLDEPTWAAIRAAFEEHSVLVFHSQPMDDDAQIAFSRRFGSLEVTRSINPAAGTPFARQSNLEIRTGEVIPPDDRRMVYQLANLLWHSDSSFKAVPSLCSLLSARIVPRMAAPPSSPAPGPPTRPCRTRCGDGSRRPSPSTTSPGRGTGPPGLLHRGVRAAPGLILSGPRGGLMSEPVTLKVFTDYV
jgi:Taurine catabolism dioxygenase TauD, TfdA family